MTARDVSVVAIAFGGEVGRAVVGQPTLEVVGQCDLPWRLVDTLVSLAEQLNQQGLSRSLRPFHASPQLPTLPSDRITPKVPDYRIAALTPLGNVAWHDRLLSPITSELVAMVPLKEPAQVAPPRARSTAQGRSGGCGSRGPGGQRGCVLGVSARRPCWGKSGEASPLPLRSARALRDYRPFGAPAARALSDSFAAQVSANDTSTLIGTVLKKKEEARSCRHQQDVSRFFPSVLQHGRYDPTSRLEGTLSTVVARTVLLLIVPYPRRIQLRRLNLLQRDVSLAIASRLASYHPRHCWREVRR